MSFLELDRLISYKDDSLVIFQESEHFQIEKKC
jgi:hypothetical protein